MASLDLATTPTTGALPTTPGPTRRPPRPARRNPLRLLRRWVSPVVLLGLWQALSSAGVIDERTIASPAQIFTRAVELVQDGTLGSATLTSLQRVGIGFAIGAAIGMTLAIVAGLSRIGEDAIDPPMQMLRTLPHFGLIPLFILWFGIGEQPKITLIAMGVTFPLYLNTFAGIRNIDRKTIEAARAMNLTWVQRVRHVIVPGALPQTLTGLRQSLGIAWLSLIVAETISASSGLGYMINNARDFLQTDVIVVGLAVYSLLGLATDGIVRYLEGRALAWRS
ncbi:ABC transporter permease [Nocardioides sp. SYSU D00038]|uniref:ABC transporter permease n=1 Tax=Nocardioides sp. SYSU D00038 TaxID=2812554 RepID=UPI0019679059|nr:ABC transporter permease [Nocardioides sp. SYSU D00038]